MIDISTALQNILKAVYGKDVRQSIHDAIFQINANANEAIDLAQIKFGTAITSPTSPTGSYIENTIYFNVMTGIVWRLDGGSWSQLGTFKAIDTVAKTNTVGKVDTYTITYNDGSTSTFDVTNGADGKDGVSIVNVTKTTTSGKVDHYEINLSDGTTTPSGIDVTNGSDGKSIANITLASTVGNVKNYDVLLDDGTKTPTGFSVSDGTSSYVHIRYSANFDGTGMVTVPTDATVYIGIVVTSQSVAPTDPSVYSWVRFIGKSGTGSGDMLAADYSTKYAGVVDKAAALYDGTNEIQANQLMDKTVYDADNDGIVDDAAHADNADKVGNADTSVLEKFGEDSTKPTYNGNKIMLDISMPVTQYKSDEFKITNYGLHNKELSLHSNITTKLAKVDDKIDKPTSATEGQVLTYRNNEWVADDSQGGGGHFVIIAKGEIYEGQTVTATKGTKSKSVVITSGVARIPVDEGGVWTLTLSSGETWNTPNMTYYGEYEVLLVPNGATVTPTDDIQTWLKCGSLIKDYTTLEQVCADTTTLVSLMNNENANKYLVRSTNFATTLCGNKNFSDQLALVKYNDLFDNLTSNATWYNAIIASAYFTTICPLLNNVAHTSETSSVGTASETGHKEGFPFWYALKLLSDTQGNRTIWYAETGQTGTYTFKKKCKVLRFEYENSLDGSLYYGNVDIYSNDDNVKIASNTGVAENNKKYTINIAKDKLSYNIAYKFVATAVNNGLTFTNLRMYGRYID